MCDLDASNCNKDCKSLVVELIQMVDMSTGFHSLHQTHVIAKREYEGLGKGETTGGFNRFLELPLDTIRNKVKNHRDKVMTTEDY